MHKKSDLRRSLNLDTLDWTWLGINLLFWGIRDRIWINMNWFFCPFEVISLRLFDCDMVWKGARASIHDN